MNSPPQLFGLHKNAGIGYNHRAVANILANLLKVQSMNGTFSTQFFFFSQTSKLPKIIVYHHQFFSQ